MGKIALIMYLFAFGILFFGYYINQGLQNPQISANPKFSYQALSTLTASFNTNQSVSPELIFGDFLAGAKLLFSIVTGVAVHDAFSSIPQISEPILLLITGMFAFFSVLLWIFMIANRSL